MENNLKFLFFAILLCIAPSTRAMGLFKGFKKNLTQKTNRFNYSTPAYINNGLKVALGCTTAISLGILGKNTHTKYSAIGSDSGDRHILRNGVLFGPQQQESIYKEIQHLYPLSEPLLFGAWNESLAIRRDGCNYIFLQTDDLPEHLAMKNWQQKGESLEECTDRVKKLKEKNSQNRMKYYEQKGIEHILQNNRGSLKHELGHVVLQHIEKRDTTEKNILLLNTLTATLMHGLSAKNLTHSLTNMNLIKRCGLIGLINPLAYTLYKTFHTKVMRQQEREADAFAIAHANSVEELTKELDFFKKWEGVYLKHRTLKNRIFATHPSFSERIQTLERAIEQRKSLEKAL